MRSLLAMERIALNFLQRLSGIATLTARFVAATAGTRAAIYDTRKTTPGWRALEKYAVRCGGGRNHRFGLYDAVLIKDNHLAWLRPGGLDGAGPIAAAVATARANVPAGTIVEVEVDTLEQLDVALRLRPRYHPGRQPRVRTGWPRPFAAAMPSRPGSGSRPRAASAWRRVGALAATGVDRISVGALTHSAPALDLAMDLREPTTGRSARRQGGPDPLMIRASSE